MADQRRFEQLMNKRTGTASDSEDDELGQMFAEREHKHYTNAEEAHEPARRSRQRALGVFRRMGRHRRESGEGDRAA
jgi:hypothetical protein